MSIFSHHDGYYTESEDSDDDTEVSDVSEAE